MEFVFNIPNHFFLDNNSDHFAYYSQALDELGGLIAIGGDLGGERLLSAYRQGIFPWYSQGQPIMWYHPNPRMVITPNTLKISHSLQKILKQQRFEVRINQNFAQVIGQCASIKRKDQDGTWITDAMQIAYLQLHQQNKAQSIEVYEQDKLVGGLYGVTLGQVFFGESMFSIVNNASKIALVHLLTKMPYTLVDCQVENQHLKSLGAFNVSREFFVKQLKVMIETFA